MRVVVDTDTMQGIVDGVADGSISQDQGETELRNMAVGYEEAVSALESMGVPPDLLAGAAYRYRMVFNQLAGDYADIAVAVRDSTLDTIEEKAEAVVEASSIATSVAIPSCP